MKHRPGLLGFTSCLVLAACVISLSAQPSEKPADQAKTSAKEKMWKPEDVVMTETAGQFRISPDGKWVAWVKNVPDKEKDGRVSNLFLSSMTEKKEIQLTRGTETHNQPRWSPNGELISFISTRPLPKPKPDASKTQLWLINPFGGEPWPLTEFDRGMRAYEWIDNDTIIFSAEEDPSLYETETKKKKDATRVVDDVVHTPPVRLFRLAVKDKKVTRLTENDDWLESWAVSRDGKRAVTVHAQYLSYEWDQKIPPKVFLYDLAGGQRQQIFADGKIRPFFLRWARDNSGFYAVAPYTSHPAFYTATINLLYYYDAASGNVTQVKLDWENGLGFGLEVTDDGFVALLAAGARFKPARFVRSVSSWTRAWIEGEHVNNLFSFALGDDGKTIAYEHSTASKPDQWYRATLEGTRITLPVQFTDLNPQLQKKTLAKTEVVQWKGALDEEVEGILYYPHNYEAGKRYPLVVAIHGGPAGADLDAWDDSMAYPQNLFNQRGAFVLKPNYHGSGNYGLKWVESICCGKYYDLEVPDIEKGIDSLISKGMVDPERIGTMGWSNGSILSTQLLVTNPERFKAASVGAGDVEWISDWANVDFGQAFDAYYFGKSPLEDPELYIRKSPVFKMDRVRTPTLIFFGTEDRNVPTSQGWTHYRALYQIDKVPVRFLLFPGESHGPRKLTHQIRKVEEEMTWFDRYLFKTEKAANEAFKEDSPLGIAIKRQAIQKSGTRYGGVHKAPGAKRGETQEVLIPEVVKHGDLEIGRFEVTRAQYAAFDSNYKFDAGTDNYPVNGITLENAKAYAAWLSKLTGQTYRISNDYEVEALYKPTGSENTLDYWAGYQLNPEDTERLEAKSKELTGKASLLKEVGSFAPAGSEDEELVFDLGGNVAEWVLATDGTGKTIGGSADRPADPKVKARAVDIAYTGLRVVRGEAKKKEEKKM